MIRSGGEFNPSSIPPTGISLESAPLSQVGSSRIRPDAVSKVTGLARFTDDHKGRILITPASLRRGLEDGLSVREMIDFLKTHDRGDEFRNIEHLMNEVVEKTGNIFVGGEPFRLEVSDKMLLDELLLQKRFLPFIQERAQGGTTGSCL